MVGWAHLHQLCHRLEVHHGVGREHVHLVDRRHHLEHLRHGMA
jgi:hypothetical protein